MTDYNEKSVKGVAPEVANEVLEGKVILLTPSKAQTGKGFWVIWCVTLPIGVLYFHNLVHRYGPHNFSITTSLI